MQNLPLKQVKTIVIPKVSWSKLPKPKKGAVICTRLILQVALGAIKNTQFRRVLRGPFTLGKCPSRTVRGVPLEEIPADMKATKYCCTY